MRKFLLAITCFLLYQTGYSQCGSYPTPFLETFDGGTTPTCWTESGSEAWRYSTGADYDAGNAGDHTGNNGNYAWIDGSSPNGPSQISTLTSPLISVSSLLNPEVSFWLFSHNTNDASLNTLTVEVNDGTNWNLMFTHQADLGPAWNRVGIDLGSLTITGDIQVRFTITENGTPNAFYNDILIDDVGVNEGPYCPAPINFAASNVTTNSADLSWGGNGSNFELEVLLAANTPTGVGQPVTGSSFTASGLSAATAYQAWVREICGGDSLIISGVLDGPLTGGSPKVVELYVIDSIPDLSRYGLGAANNGGGTDGVEFVFPAVSASAGDYIYVTNDSAQFNAFFGFNPDFLGGNGVGINGDDAVELFKDSVAIDVFGDVNVDGTGEPWEYMDGWAYRKMQQVPNGGTFMVAAWDYSGPNALDTCTVVSCGAATFPYGTFMTSLVSEWAGPVNFLTQCGFVAGDSSNTAIMVNTPVFADTGNTSLCYTNTVSNASNDVYYMVVLDPCATEISASLCGSSYDTYLRFFNTNLSQLAANDDACGLQSEILNFSVSGIDTLFVVVEGFSGNNGAYVLDITQTLASPDPSFSYAQTSYCVGDAGMMATISGDTGGVFTTDPGLVIDPNTGMLDPQNSSAGMYNVVYTVGFGQCFNSDTVMVTLSQDDATFFYLDSSYCMGASNPIPTVTGTQGGTFNAPIGAAINTTTGEIDLNSAIPGTYTITYATAGSCPDTASFDVTINMMESGAFSYTDSVFCKSDPNNPVPTITGTSGGTFEAVLGASVNSTTGEIDLGSAFPGTYAISYMTPGICADTVTLNITILQGSAAFSYPQSSYCIGDTAIAIPSVTGDAGGTFSSASGLPVNAATGQIDLQNASADSNHTVTYVSPAPCSDTVTVTLIVNDCSNSLLDQLQALPVEVYPNPNAGSFYLRMDGSNLDVQATVYDLRGQKVLDQAIRLQNGLPVRLDLGQVAEGVYTLRLQNKEGIAIKKLIVR